MTKLKKTKAISLVLTLAMLISTFSVGMVFAGTDVGGSNPTESIELAKIPERIVIDAAKLGIDGIEGSVTTNGSASGIDDVVSSNGTKVVEVTTFTQAKAGDTLTVPVTFTPDDTGTYDAKQFTYTLNVTKDTPVVTVNNVDLVYTGADQYSTVNLTGTALVNSASVEGTYTFKEVVQLRDVADSGLKEVTFTPTDSEKYNTVQSNVTVNIAKAEPTLEVSDVNVTYTGTKLGNDAIQGRAVLVATSVSGTFKWGDAVGDLVDASSNGLKEVVFTPEDNANYREVKKNITVTINPADYDVTVEPVVATFTGTAVGNDVLQGTAKFGDSTDVEGAFTWADSQNLTNAGENPTAGVIFTPVDRNKFKVKNVTVSLTINKKAVTGEPEIVYDGEGTKLSDYEIKKGTVSEEGTFKWVLPGETEVVAGTSYAWKFTPTDEVNVANLEGTVVVKAVALPSVAGEDIEVNIHEGDLVYGGIVNAKDFKVAGAKITGVTLVSGGTLGRAEIIKEGAAVSIEIATITAEEVVFNVRFEGIEPGKFEPAVYTLTFNVLPKETPVITAKPIEVVYTGEALTDDLIKGKAVVGDKEIAGWFSFSAAPTNVSESSDYVAIQFIPDDTMHYKPAMGVVKVTIKKAPTDVLLVAAGSGAEATLADFTLSVDREYVDVEGTLEWVKDTSTAVVEGEAYEWVFKPADGNYADAKGTLILKRAANDVGGNENVGKVAKFADVVSAGKLVINRESFGIAKEGTFEVLKVEGLKDKTVLKLSDDKKVLEIEAFDMLDNVNAEKMVVKVKFTPAEAAYVAKELVISVRYEASDGYVVTTEKLTLKYNGEDQSETDKVKATAKIGDKVIKGSFEIMARLRVIADAGVKPGEFIPENEFLLASKRGTVEVDMLKGDIKGTPVVTKVGSTDTLASYELSSENLTTKIGSFAWVKEADTKVEKGVSYEFIYTPADTNWNALKGAVVLKERKSGGKSGKGGGGGGSVGTTKPVETKKAEEKKDEVSVGVPVFKVGKDDIKDANGVVKYSDSKVASVLSNAGIKDMDKHWAKASAAYVIDKGIFTGVAKVSKGENVAVFAPKDLMTRGMVTTVLYRLAGAPATNANNTGMSDIDASAWYADGVAWALQNGIANGMGDKQFAPNQSITREAFVKMLYSYSLKNGKIKEYKRDSLLNYVDGFVVNDWAEEAVIWALETGLMKGIGPSELAPYENITRAEVATIFERYLRTLESQSGK